MNKEIFLIELENELKQFKEKLMKISEYKVNKKKEKDELINQIKAISDEINQYKLENNLLWKIREFISNIDLSNLIDSTNNLKEDYYFIKENLNIISEKENQLKFVLEEKKNQIKNIKHDICLDKKLIREKFNDINIKKYEIEKKLEWMNENIDIYSESLDDILFENLIKNYELEIEDKESKSKQLEKEIKNLKIENDFKLNLKNNEYMDLKKEFDEFLKNLK